MKLHELPHEEIKKGAHVLSRRGRLGTITEAAEARWFAITIQWSSEPPWDKEEQTVSCFYLYPDTISEIEYLGLE